MEIHNGPSERAWAAFREQVPWFVHRRPNAKPTRTLPPGSWTPRSAEFRSLFPELTDLLSEASLTEVRLLSDRWTLYTWESQDGGYRGWLSPAASPPPDGLHPHHRVLLESFDGIVESFGDVDSWIKSHNHVLTPAAAEEDATFAEACAWAFEETGGIPIDLEAYYVVAEEGNGNATLCHRREGDILLFAVDHAFDYVSVLEGCPELTFYRLNGAPTLASWVNHVAKQWRAPSAGRANPRV